MAEAFDAIADAYDRWYDTLEGEAIFQAEVDCLRLLCKEFRGRWLEVGVGTGRFAVALGVKEGTDPSPQMLEKAAHRVSGGLVGGHFRGTKGATGEPSLGGYCEVGQVRVPEEGHAIISNGLRSRHRAT